MLSLWLTPCPAERLAEDAEWLPGSMGKSPKTVWEWRR